MDAVANRAGASKATLYRRWPDRLSLAVHLLERAVAERPPVPSTGTVRNDLTALLRSLDEELHGAVGALVLGLAAEARRAPGLAEDLQTYRAVEQDRARKVLAAGVERGKLDPGTDLDLLAALPLANGLERVTSAAAPLTRQAAEDLADRLLAACAVGYGYSGPDR
jgi:AcrR family transcriptional regulator